MQYQPVGRLCRRGSGGREGGAPDDTRTEVGQARTFLAKNP